MAWSFHLLYFFSVKFHIQFGTLWLQNKGLWTLHLLHRMHKTHDTLTANTIKYYFVYWFLKEGFHHRSIHGMLLPAPQSGLGVVLTKVNNNIYKHYWFVAILCRRYDFALSTIFFIFRRYFVYCIHQYQLHPNDPPKMFSFERRNKKKISKFPFLLNFIWLYFASLLWCHWRRYSCFLWPRIFTG